jgi:hypothetical protein
MLDYTNRELENQIDVVRDRLSKLEAKVYALHWEAIGADTNNNNKRDQSKLRTGGPKTTFSFFGKQRVKLATGIRCPHCELELRASDVQLVDDGVELELICSGCHVTLLTIERLDDDSRSEEGLAS